MKHGIAFGVCVVGALASMACTQIPQEDDPLPTSDVVPSSGGGDAPGTETNTGTTNQTPQPQNSGTPSPGASPPSTSTDPCQSGASIAIFGFRNGERFAYSATNDPPAGFKKDGVVFRLVPTSTSSASGAKKELHLLYSAQADDYLVSLSKNEASSLGYVYKETLGSVFVNKQGASTPLYRYVKSDPSLRHWSSIATSGAPNGFTSEGPMGHVCP
jgi:hypothetical protein